MRDPSDSTAASGARVPSAANSARPNPGDLCSGTRDVRGRTADPVELRRTGGRGCARARRLDHGRGCDPPLRDLELQAARDSVLRVQLKRRVERGGGLVELAAFHVAARQPRQRALVRRRDLRQLEVGRERLRAEVAGLRILDGALLQLRDGRHPYSVSGRARSRALPECRLILAPVRHMSRRHHPVELRADRAAKYPHIPWTPTPGGVDDEHK